MRGPQGRVFRRLLNPVRDEFSSVGPDGKRVDKPLPERVQGWARGIRRFGGRSMFRSLAELAGLDERTVELVSTLENQTSRGRGGSPCRGRAWGPAGEAARRLRTRAQRQPIGLPDGRGRW